MVKAIDFNGIRIISNPYIPEGTVFVNPKDYLLFKDPEKWQQIKDKATQEMLDKLELINKNFNIS